MVLVAKFSKNTYKVTFILDNGKSDIETAVEYGEKVEEPTAPTKKGYTFAGWYYLGNQFDFNTEIKSDLNITAIWRKKNEEKPIVTTTYIVEHYLMGLDGEYDKVEKEEKFTAEIGTTVKPKTKDYKGFTSPKEKIYEVKENDELVVKYYYERNKYTLTIQSDEGIDTVFGAGEYYYGSEVKLNVKVKNGYTFKEWSNHEPKTEWIYKVKDQSETLKATSTLNEYKILYELNGGELKSKKESYTILDDDYVLSEPTKVGYEFLGWKVNGNDSNGVISKGTYGDLTFVAVFKANENTPYIVNHYLMDLDGIHYTLQETEKLTGTTDSIITPETKLYDGFKEPDKISTSIQADGSTIVEYRYERKRYNLSITYVNVLDESDLEGIKQITNSATYYYGEKVEIRIDLEKGFHLEEWSNGIKETAFTYTITSLDHQSLQAKIKRNEHNVTFDGQNGSVIESQKEYFGKQISKPNDPVKEGYTFLGWFRNDTDEEWNFEREVMPDEDISLYAKWEIHKDTVIFDANEGLFTDGKEEKVILNQELGSHIKKIEENPTREGYKFAGWYREDSDVEWNFNQDTMPGEALRLQAHWTPITYTIHFDGNTNTTGSMDDITCIYNQECSLTTNTFAKEYQVIYDENRDLEPKSLETQVVKYNFKNWKYNNQTFTNEEKVRNLISEENQIVTLTAEWVINEDTATLKNISKTGYDFAGWYKDEQIRLDNLHDISENLELQAHWTPITYTIIFDGNGGNHNGNSQVEVTATYDQTTKTLGDFVKSYQLTYNYDNGKNNKTESYSATFVGWKLNDTTYQVNQELGNLTTIKGQVITLKAEWTNPTVSINEQEPTKESTENYYQYDFKDFTDGDLDYELEDTITLSKDTTLIAEYLKIIDTDQYVKDKLLTTSDRTDFKVTGDSSRNYKIDILDVTAVLVNENDTNRLDTILQSNDVKSIEVSLEDNPSTLLKEIVADAKVILSKTDNIKEKMESFLNSITSKNTVEEKHLGSLWKKKLAITVHFDEEYAKEKNGSNSVIYHIEYTHTTNTDKIVTQEKLDAIADAGILEINNSVNKPYQAKRFGNTVYATYKEGIGEEAVGSTILTGGTGLNNCMNAFFNYPEVLNAIISVYSDEKQSKDYLIEPLGVVDKAKIDGGMGALIPFAISMLDALGLSDLGLFGVLNETTIHRPMYMRIDLDDHYIYEDGVNNVYYVEIVKPEEFESKK